MKSLFASVCLVAIAALIATDLAFVAAMVAAWANMIHTT